MSRWRVAAAAAVTVGLLAGLSGCSSGQEPAGAFTGPWGPEVKAAYESATDPAVKATLEDGKITQAEYEAAVQRMVKCAADQGVTVTPEKQPNGMYGYGLGSNSSEAASVVDSCVDQTLKPIELLYGPMLINPQNQDINELYAGCLRRAGVVPRDYTGEQFLADQRAMSGPFAGETLDPAVQQCMLNPSVNDPQADSAASG